METAELKRQLKEQIIHFLNLTSVKPEDIKDDEPLFGVGLGLDSIGLYRKKQNQVNNVI